MSFIIKNRLLAALTLFVLLALPLSIIFMAGCASKLEGEMMANQPPEVGFINAPPESTNFSRNSVVYWWGTDPDGVISYFRYHVATVDIIGSQTLDQYVASVQGQASKWTIVPVDIVGGSPGTEKIIKLSADLADPVNRFVIQYVFLQAFDEQGMASTIVWRAFGRNDNPPQTVIFNPPVGELPFVNAETKGGIITGVKMRWAGTDPIDYPTDPPPFDYHYRLYGPFSNAQFAQIQSQFFTKRYVTATGLVYKLGDTIVTCDTTIIVPQQITCDSLGQCDTTSLPPDTTINCQTIIVRTTTPCSAFGCLQDYFAIDNPTYISTYPDSMYMVYQSRDPLDNTVDSIWVDKTADTLFNVFGKFAQSGAADTTIEQNFVFWVRCRDDALVPDLVPAFKPVNVINPKHERSILIVDVSSILTPTRKWSNSYFNENIAKGYWYDVIEKWANGDVSKLIDTARVPGTNQTPDYFVTGRNNNIIPITLLLKHKVVILYNEGVARFDMGGSTGLMPNIYRAIDAGVNVWSAFRSLGGSARQPYTVGNPNPPNYARYFGVAFTTYSGWLCHAFGDSLSFCAKTRMEDFVGGKATRSGWPDIAVDSGLLRTMLRWADPSDNINYPPVGFHDSLPKALSEVGWSVRTFGTELLYLYKSHYGNGHPLGRTATRDYIFEGAPVAHRLNAGLFKSVHSNFTPLVLDTITGQVMIDSILNWLYDPNLGSSSIVKEDRYPGAALKLTMEDAKENYRRRIEEIEAMSKIEEANGGF